MHMNWKQTFYQLRNEEKGREKRSAGSFAQEVLGPHIYLNGQKSASAPLDPNIASDKKETEIGKVMESLDQYIQEKGKQSPTVESEKEVTVAKVKFSSRMNSDLEEVIFNVPADGPKNLQELIQLEESCQACPSEAIQKRGKVVHELSGVNPPLDVLFIGYSPTGKISKAEDPQCIAGETGELLSKMIVAMKIPQDKVGITLLRKCYSPVEEEFSDVMLESCRNHFISELSLLRPKVVVTLGAVATNAVLNKKQRLSTVHGVFHSSTLKQEEVELHKFQVVPLFHPEFLLINPKMKKTAWVDLQKIMSFLE